MIENLDKALVYIFKSEAGFQSDSHDTGNKLPDGRAGCTNLGVTQAAWETYVGHPVTWNDMRALTTVTVTPFYKRKYWDAVRGDDLPTGIDYMMFDFAINAGPGRAIKLLQECVGEKADGVLGPISMSTIKAMPIKLLIQRFTDTKEKFYKSLNNPKYEHGWLARNETVEINALHMYV
jgi:lysozyme family protein